MLLLLIGAMALVLVPRFARGRVRGELLSGTLLVTGVSPRPESVGQQFVTIAGVIKGPNVDEHPVYQRMIVDVDQWPVIGQLLPVRYSPSNPDNWTFEAASPDQSAG